MNIRPRLFVAAVAACTGVSVLAQPPMRPGLWDETITVKSDNAQANAAMAQMQERLASMPPEQRAAIEKMMASRGMGTSPGAPNTRRVCITQAQIDRGFMPDRDGRCSRANVSTSGSVTRFDFACKTEHNSVTGHGMFTTMGDTAFTVSSVADTVGDKATMHVQSDIAGKFVASDCGDVKPMDAPAK